MSDLTESELEESFILSFIHELEELAAGGDLQAAQILVERFGRKVEISDDKGSPLA